MANARLDARDTRAASDRGGAPSAPRIEQYLVSMLWVGLFEYNRRAATHCSSRIGSTRGWQTKRTG
jgi:hypothetical protein